jgi:hypothetical protein
MFNELRYFHRSASDHDPKGKVDFQRDRHRASPFHISEKSATPTRPESSTIVTDSRLRDTAKRAP